MRNFVCSEGWQRGWRGVAVVGELNEYINNLLNYKNVF